MAGERDMLATAINTAQVQARELQLGRDLMIPAARVLAALAACGWRLVPSAPDEAYELGFERGLAHGGIELAAGPSPEPLPREALDVERLLDRLMELWQEPWSEAAFGEAQMLLSRIRPYLVEARSMIHNNRAMRAAQVEATAVLSALSPDRPTPP